MRPIRAYQASLCAQHKTVFEIPNIPPSSPKNAAIYLPEVDATQPPDLLGVATASPNMLNSYLAYPPW